MATLNLTPFGYFSAADSQPPSPSLSLCSSESYSDSDEELLQTPVQEMKGPELTQLKGAHQPIRTVDDCSLASAELIAETCVSKLLFEPMARLPSQTAALDSILPTTALTDNAQLKQKGPAVLVIGLGYVGEHLLAGFAGAYSTTGFDVSSARCAELRRSYEDNSNVAIFESLGELDQHEGAYFDLAVISVPTLIKADGKTVDYRHVESAVNTVARYARPGSTVVMESSVSVGLTRQLLSPLHRRGVHIGFSPERVDPGRVAPLYHEIPKVISGIDEASLEKVDGFYRQVFQQTVRVPSLETAEFCKLYENCQRLMLIAFVNEAADACEKIGVDIADVCAASATKPFGYTPFTASLGAGGHCLPVNPFYLLASGLQMPLLQQATEANAQRPLQKAHDVMQKASTVLKLSKRPFAPRILVYGLAYKPGTDCLDYSCAVSMAEQLTKLGANVSYFDECVSSDRWQRLSRHELQETVDDGTFAIDEEFDVVAVCQKPTVADKAVLDTLQRCQVVHYAR